MIKFYSLIIMTLLGQIFGDMPMSDQEVKRFRFAISAENKKRVKDWEIEDWLIKADKTKWHAIAILANIKELLLDNAVVPDYIQKETNCNTIYELAARLISGIMLGNGFDNGVVKTEVGNNISHTEANLYYDSVTDIAKYIIADDEIELKHFDAYKSKSNLNEHITNVNNTLKSTNKSLQAVKISFAEDVQNKALEGVLNCKISNIAEDINNILEKVKIEGKYTLLLGDKTQWRNYVTAALKAVYKSDKWIQYSKNVENELSNATNRYEKAQELLAKENLTPLTIDQIKKAFVKHQIKNSKTGNPTYTIVKGVDAKLLALSPKAKNGILQVASQFNFLESVSSDYSNIESYIHDPTQGPMASLGSLAALVLRDFFFKQNPAYSQSIFSGLEDEVYEGGYLQPHRAQDEKALLAMLESKIGELRVLAQWGKPKVGNDPLLQIFTAAPSYQGCWKLISGDYNCVVPQVTKTGETICKLLVAAQYSAVAQIAAMRSVTTSESVPLHLTLVGQGAFNNPENVMKEALQAVYETLKGFNVDVYIHGYTADGIDSIKRNAPDGMNIKNLSLMTAKDFLSN